MSNVEYLRQQCTFKEVMKLDQMIHIKSAFEMARNLDDQEEMEQIRNKSR